MCVYSNTHYFEKKYNLLRESKELEVRIKITHEEN